MLVAVDAVPLRQLCVRLATEGPGRGRELLFDAGAADVARRSPTTEMRALEYSSGCVRLGIVGRAVSNGMATRDRLVIDEVVGSRAGPDP